MPRFSKRVKAIALPILRMRYFILNWFSTVNEKPIFVVGHHKTGTTAIASILASACGASISQDQFNAREWYPLKDLITGRLGFDRYVDQSRFHLSADIIKEPDFIYLVDITRHHFPNARFIFTIRDPRDTIRSILDRLGIDGTKENLDSGDKIKLRTMPGWKMILDPSVLDIESKQYIEVLAHRWRKAAIMYERHKDIMSLIRYEDFLADRESVIRESAEWAGLYVEQWAEEYSRVQFQPQGHRRCQDWQTVFGNKNLDRIERICGDVAINFGYPVS